MDSRLPWDVFKHHPQLIDPERPGLYGLWSYDPFVERMLLRRLPRLDWGVVTGDEIGVDWLHSHLVEQDFFSPRRSFLVLQAGSMSKTVWQFFSEREWNWEGRFFVMVSPQLPFFGRTGGKLIKIEPPRFWEGPLLLQFLCEHMRVSLPEPVREYVLEAVPNTAGEFIQALKMLALGCQGRSFSVARARELIHPRNLDQFQLAAWFDRQQLARFFKTLVETDLDFDSLRSFFVFMQSHLHKLGDPSYIRKKKRPNRYDKSVLAGSRCFGRDQLRRWMRFFGQLEILAKQRSGDLLNRIKAKHLETLC